MLMPDNIHGPRSVYEVVLMHLAGDRLNDCLKPAPEGDDHHHGPLQTPQRAGTCYFRSINACIKYVARRIFHWDVSKTKRLMLALRCSYLLAAEKHLSTISPDTPTLTVVPVRADASDVDSISRRCGPDLLEVLTAPELIDADVHMIRLGAQQTIRAAGKAVLRGHIDEVCSYYGLIHQFSSHQMHEMRQLFFVLNLILFAQLMLSRCEVDSF